MKKIFTITTFVIQLAISGCQADTFHYYKDEVAELTRDPKTRKIDGSESDASDLKGCQYLIELGQWQREDNKKWGASWSRSNVWKNISIYHYKISSVYEKSYDLSSKILQNKSIHPIYIGPWHHSPRINKTIRFFAYTGIGGGNIQYQYESQTEENKNIQKSLFHFHQI